MGYKDWLSKRRVDLKCERQHAIIKVNGGIGPAIPKVEEVLQNISSIQPIIQHLTMPNVRKRTTKPTPDPSTPLPSTPQRQQRKGESIRLIIGAFLILGAIYIVLTRSPSKTILPDGRKIWKRDQRLWSTEVEGHGDFEDGRRRLVNRDFVNPPSKALHWVNVILGNGGWVCLMVQY